MHDVLQRRLPFAPPQPRGKRIVLGDTDLKIFEALHRHGPLPTHYLHAFARTHRKNLQARLTKLYNGSGGVAYLTRPPEYFESFFARYQPIVYDLHDNAKKLLQRVGKLSPFINRNDHLIHRLMTACVMSSVELACSNRRWEFISRDRILARLGNPMRLPLSRTDGRDVLEPDELFGVRGEKLRFFAVEVDRGTEQMQSARHRKTIEATVRAYNEIMERRTYHDAWGIPNLHVFIATTNEARMLSIHKLVSASDRFHLQCYPEFSAPWHMPPVYGIDLDRLLT